MSRTSNAARALLRLMIVLNLGLGVLLAMALGASFVFETALTAYYRRGGADATVLVPALRIMILLGAPYVAALHILLSRLSEIVETVRVGTPFVPANAARLKAIAWSLLGLQLVGLAFGAMAAIAAAAKADIDWSFSIGGWVAVLLLFVLAGVFEDGTRMSEEGDRMRDDLEAMI